MDAKLLIFRRIATIETGMQAHGAVLANVAELTLADRFDHNGRTWTVDRAVTDPDMPGLTFIRTVEGPVLRFSELDIVWMAEPRTSSTPQRV